MNEEVAARIHEFFSAYPVRKYAKGHIITHAGDDPEGVLHLTDGKVRQYDISARGDEIVVNVFQPPAFFPLSWVTPARE